MLRLLSKFFLEKSLYAGGLKLYSINVTFYKNELDHKLQKENSDSGSITIHAATGNNFAKQMCAEYQDEREILDLS